MQFLERISYHSLLHLHFNYLKYCLLFVVKYKPHLLQKSLPDPSSSQKPSSLSSQAAPTIHLQGHLLKGAWMLREGQWGQGGHSSQTSTFYFHPPILVPNSAKQKQLHLTFLLGTVAITHHPWSGPCCFHSTARLWITHITLFTWRILLQHFLYVLSLF